MRFFNLLPCSASILAVVALFGGGSCVDVASKEKKERRLGKKGGPVMVDTCQNGLAIEVFEPLSDPGLDVPHIVVKELPVEDVRLVWEAALTSAPDVRVVDRFGPNYTASFLLSIEHVERVIYPEGEIFEGLYVAGKPNVRYVVRCPEPPYDPGAVCHVFEVVFGGAVRPSPMKGGLVSIQTSCTDPNRTCQPDGCPKPSAGAGLRFDCCNCGSDFTGKCQACSSSKACFSSLSHAVVEGKGEVPMENLRVGDRVLTHGAGGPKFETVYEFGDWSRKEDATFLQIYVGGQNKPLEITPDHLLYVQGNMLPIASGEVQVGDTLVGGNPGLPSPKVERIESVSRKGIYAPLTPGGNIIVDGILASCYNSQSEDWSPQAAEVDGIPNFVFSWHLISHVWLAPRRLICLGLSLKLCQPSEIPDEGLSDWAEVGEGVAEFYARQSAVFRAAVLVTFFALMLPLFALEQVVLSPPVLLAAVVAASAAYYFSRRSTKHSSKKLL